MQLNISTNSVYAIKLPLIRKSIYLYYFKVNTLDDCQGNRSIIPVILLRLHETSHLIQTLFPILYRNVEIDIEDCEYLVAEMSRRLTFIILCNLDFFIFKRDINSKSMLLAAQREADNLRHILMRVEIALHASKKEIQLFFPQCFHTDISELRSV